MQQFFKTRDQQKLPYLNKQSSRFLQKEFVQMMPQSGSVAINTDKRKAGKKQFNSAIFVNPAVIKPVIGGR